MARKPKVEINEKGKSSLIVFVILLVILIVLTILLIVTRKEDKPSCQGIVGGAFTVKFETNGGNAISDVDVCVACAPDSYSDLAVPTKSDYKFTGWYYDKELTSPVSGESTANISPEINFVDGCIVGYKSITLYAGWE